MHNYFSKLDTKYISILILFYCLYVLNLYFLFKGDNSLESYKCYLLNYDGGFVRRGLLGEIIKIISVNFNFHLSNIFFSIFLFVYSIFFFFFYKLTEGLEKNILFYFFIFSPINFLFLLVQLNYELPVFLGNFEIFLITFFLFYIYLTLTSINRIKIFLIGIFGLIFLVFIYEMTFFIVPFFFLVYYNFLTRNNYKIKIFEVIIFLSIIFLIAFIHIYFYGKYDLNIFFKNIFLDYKIILNINDKYCTYEWMNREISNQFTIFYPDFKISYLIRHIFYAHPILILFFYCINKSKDKENNLILIISICTISTLFLIATDWARFIHIIYLFSLFSIILIFYNKKKDIFSIMYKNNFLHKINKSLLIFIVILYCSSWTLKHTYWQNHLSYALIKVIKYNFDSISRL